MELWKMFMPKLFFSFAEEAPVVTEEPSKEETPEETPPVGEPETPPAEEPPIEEPEEEPAKSEDPPKEMISKEEAQKRIDRMYARLQAERSKSTLAPSQDLDTIKSKMPRQEMDEYGEPIVTPTPGFTAKDAEAIWDRKEKQKLFRESETKVFIRHSEILNEDGSFNLESTFAKEYLKIGQENPGLAWMVNGPELAEAMVEKKLGFSYKKGKVDAIVQESKKQGAHTAKSTVATPAKKIVKLDDVKKKIAARMHMSEQEYIDWEARVAASKKVK